MSLEETMQLLINEIRQLCSLLKTNNVILQKETAKKETTVKTSKMINEKEAAKYLGMSRSFLAQDRMNGYRSIRVKGPKFVKFGRRVMYDIDELDAWLTENMQHK